MAKCPIVYADKAEALTAQNSNDARSTTIRQFPRRLQSLGISSGPDAGNHRTSTGVTPPFDRSNVPESQDCQRLWCRVSQSRENPLVGQIEFARMLPIPVRYLDKALSQLLLGAHKIDIEFLLHYGLEVSALENIGRRLVGECIRRSVIAASPQL